MNYTRALYYTNPVITGTDVKYAQERLKELGFYTGNIDTSFGPSCKEATIKFQNTNNLIADGSIGPSTWNILFSFNAIPTLKYTRAIYYTSPTMIGDDITNIQRRLKSLGFYTGTIDGSFGPSCDLSTRSFQKANKLSIDGSIGPSTWNILFASNTTSSIQYNRPISYTNPIITGDDVIHVQKRLNTLGFYTGDIDGSFGPSCDLAIRNFQRTNNLDADGSIGPATWNILFNATTTGQSPYIRPLYYTTPIIVGDDVVTAQTKLKELGFYTGSIDGSFGPSCDLATRNFQRTNNLDADGSIGPATWQKLFSGNTNPSIQYTRPVFYTNPIMTGNDVIHIQRRLKELGFYTGDIDGSFGPSCKQAVIAFQKANGSDQDGSVGPGTWQLLFNNTGSIAVQYTRPVFYTNPVMTGNDVIHIQRKLHELGFYIGDIDGSFGPSCKQAVIAFQKANGLNQDGSVGPGTWSILFGGSVSSGNFQVRRVFIDPGHGGSDPGAIGNGLKEKDIVLSIALKLGALLTEKRIEVKYSRTTDIYVSLEERAIQANNWGADLFLSIHSNSFSSSSARGTECYTTSTTSIENKELSRNIALGISSKLEIPNRGHKEADFLVLKNTNMSALLVETAFISNSTDALLLNSRQNDFAIAISNRILNIPIIHQPTERIVITGSEYKIPLGELPLIPSRFKYNFIEPSIKQLREYKQNNPSEKLTWLISSAGYSQNDIINFKDTARKIGSTIIFFDSCTQLISYINTDRIYYKVNNIIVFSHGIVGSVELGYNQKSDLEKALSFKSTLISNIDKSAFNSSCSSHFYSCNTATEKTGASFAKTWFNHGLGSIQAAVNKTEYANILGKTDIEITNHVNASKEKGYHELGSVYYPELADDAYWEMFI